jgi:hypothetical protein
MEGPDMPEVPLVGGGELLITLNEIRREPPGPLLLNDPESYDQYWSYNGGGQVQYLRPNRMTVRDGWIQSDETLLSMGPYSPGDIIVEGVTRDVPGYHRVQFRIMNTAVRTMAVDYGEGPSYSGGEMYGYTNFPTRPGKRPTKKQLTAMGWDEDEDFMNDQPDSAPYSPSPDGDGTEYLHGQPD